MNKELNREITSLMLKIIKSNIGIKDTLRKLDEALDYARLSGIKRDEKKLQTLITLASEMANDKLIIEIIEHLDTAYTNFKVKLLTGE